jgi:sialate O-acetylesterase
MKPAPRPHVLREATSRQLLDALPAARVARAPGLRWQPWLLLLAALAGPAAAVEPAIGFASGMVLQQAMPLPVFGTAAPGERVTVALAAARAEATADAAGRWLATLPPQAASREPRQLVITGGDDRVVLEDVLVGEVWLCAGQSNLLFPLARAVDSASEIAAADRPLLRLFAWQPAAGGDRGAYSAGQLAALEPGRFATGSWMRCRPEAAAGFSAVGYCLGATLADKLELPVGIIAVAVGGTPAEAWVAKETLAATPATRPLVSGNWLDNPLLDDWCRSRARDNLARASAGEATMPRDDLGPAHPFKPGFMWEAGIAPLVPLAIRGVAWYQGESNAASSERVRQHEVILPVLVAGWRRAFGRELPFGVVQLPGMNRPHWPAFRDGQRRLAEAIPGTGLVVTIDLGDPRDVHPADKRPVGERLASWAIADVYGKPGPATGPLPAKAVADAAGRVTVSFRGTGGGLATADGQPPRHLEVAGPDGGFQPAVATIDGDSLIVEPAGPAPGGGIRQVRHAWLPFPEPKPNLTGQTGLPATPFEIEIER